MNIMTMTKSGETDLVVTRRFNASPEAVYDAHINLEKLKRWMLGPEGWTMPHCELDPRAGGAFSYTWEDTNSGERFTISGEFVELAPPHRTVHVERMTSEDFSSSDSRVVTEFAEDGEGTLMTMTITYDSAETREGAIASGMEAGMAVSYDNLDAMVSG